MKKKEMGEGKHVRIAQNVQTSRGAQFAGRHGVITKVFMAEMDSYCLVKVNAGNGRSRHAAFGYWELTEIPE
jgi:hypothetical protein